MGCAASKLDQVDMVRRCKERRRLMEEAVHACHLLAAAHSNYCLSLRLMGSALSSFAAGEPLSVSDESPAVLLRSPISHSSHVRPVPTSPSPSLHPPPPRPDLAPALSSHEDLKEIGDGINENCDKDVDAAAEPLSLSDPSPAVLLHSPDSHPSHAHPVPPSSSLSLDPSPPPPHSASPSSHSSHVRHVPPSPSPSLHPPPPRPDLAPALSSHEDLKEIGDGINENCDKVDAAVEPLSLSDPRPAVLLHSPDSHPSHAHPVPPSSSLSLDPSPPPPHSAPASSHNSSKEIADAIEKNFDKAAAAGDQVSTMLEIGRAQFDQSFRQLKRTVYHSNSVLGNLSSCWTSKLPLAMKYRPDTAARDELGGPKNLCSTLYQLWAWEMKLYEEVKARECAKIDHDKKLSALRSQEDYGGDKTKPDKSKASIKTLHSLIIVNSQCVSFTSTSINRLRDSELVPQLLQLCCGFMYMWRSMHQCHVVQNDIVQQVGGPVNRSENGDSTSELHRLATHDLESAVSVWHYSFCRMIKFQRDFIRSIHGWYRLTLFSVSNDNVDGNGQASTEFAFVNQWKIALDRVPDTVASEAIKSFIKAVQDMSVKQTEEHRIKKRTETLSKEFKKKASSLRSIERKFYHPYPVVGTSVPEPGPDNGQVLDAQDPLAACQRRMEDEMLRLSKAVEVTRAVTLNNLRAGLSRVFQELIRVSVSFTEALDTVGPRPFLG